VGRSIFLSALVFLAHCTLLPIYFGNAQPFPSLTGNLVEDYAAEVKVSGSTIVGVWFGKPEQFFSPNELYIRMPQVRESYDVCFSATSRDGVYFASAELDQKNPLSGTFEFDAMEQSKYKKQIASYKGHEFAMRIIESDGCSSGVGSTFLPLSLGLQSDTLLVAVNSRRALMIEAWLGSDETPTYANCDQNTLVRSITFDTVCQFDLGNTKLNGDTQLSVRRIPRAGPERIDDFIVRF